MIALQKATDARYHACIQAAAAAGCRICLGSDYVGWSPGSVSAREFRYLVELAGMSPIEAIKAGTRTYDNLDMVVGRRIETHQAAYRAGHRLGNRVLTGLVGWLFGAQIEDMLSGYRAFSRRFVKSFPALASGFETETELTVHALELDMITTEVQTPYGARPEGSESKLSTFKDGFRILGTIGRLMRDERPLLFFGALSAAIMLTSLVLAAPIIAEFMATGLVPRFPTAFLCGTLAVLSCISLVSGIILETVSLGRREMKRLAYNGIESLAAKLDRLEETRLTLTSLRSQVLSENPALGFAPRRRRTH
jgi:hypothetical protein